MPCLIITKHLEELLKRCILSIRKYSKDYELIIVDNGSHKALDYMKREADIYIRSDERQSNGYGYSKGYNTANGEYICLLDNDTQFINKWQEKCYALLNDYGFLWVGTIGTTPMMFFKKDLSNRLADVDVKTNKIGNSIIDERFYTNCFEDTDLKRRITESNIKSRLIPQGEFLMHEGSATVKEIKNHDENYKLGQQRYLDKWGNLE